MRNVLIAVGDASGILDTLYSYTPDLPMKRRSLMTRALPLAALVLLMNDADAQPAGYNYDESKVPAYTLPDPLTLNSGEKVRDARTWRRKRREEVLELFRTHVFGRGADKPRKMKCEVRSDYPNALGGKATRREVAVLLTGKEDGPAMNVLLWIPNGVKKPVPTFLGMNFGGNQTTHPDPGIALSTGWTRSGEDAAVVNNRATEASRGKAAGRWAVEKLLDHGFALATVYYGDLEPDHVDGWQSGARSVFTPDRGKNKARPASTTDEPAKGHPPEAASDEWGAIAVWAWGLSRAMDYLEKDRDIDQKRVALMGHSRLGKTALWAGAEDERFAMVISNDSGCGGAALSRRRFGETVERINTSFPHWFCVNHRRYNGREDDMPVDHHMLLALIAPRPLYVASAQDDLWADPRGEFLSALHAEPVYRLFGLEGLGADGMPAVDTPVGGHVGYHVRTGKHDVTDYDWDQYIHFAERHFKVK